MSSLSTISDVVAWRLCVGCGACAYACPEGAVELRNVERDGIRPTGNAARCAACGTCLKVCPGYRQADPSSPQTFGPQPLYGPALEIWQGYAVDPELRLAASSGGLVSALALYCLEKQGMASVLHTSAHPKQPWLNESVLSANREQLLARTGSRYSPASPCDALGRIERSERPCVFVGKPCDADAVLRCRRQRPELDGKLGLVLAFFCAGTPSTFGTKALLDSLSAPLDRVTSLRYRGNGWPGSFTARDASDAALCEISYHESWSFLQRYRPFRCHLCPDGTGQSADVSCGDAWHGYRAGCGNPGESLLIVRTERGRRIVQGAIQAKYVELKPVPGEAVLAAQEGLLARRAQLYGRLLALRTAGIPAPAFPEFDLRRQWSGLSVASRARTLIGTWKRVAARKLWRPAPMGKT